MSEDEDALPTPPWRKTRRTAKAKQPLTQDLIVDTALRIVQAEGLEGVTMRRVAQELGTGPASLYAHVGDKDELMELMLDKVAAEIPLPGEPDPDNWQEQLKTLARDMRRVWIRYRDLSLMSLSLIPTGPHLVRIGDVMLGILRAGNVPDREAGLFVDKLGMYVDADVYEGSVWARRAQEGLDPEVYVQQVRDYLKSLPAKRYPNIARMVDTMTEAGDDERFEFGLDLLIRGLNSYVEPVKE